MDLLQKLRRATGLGAVTIILITQLSGCGSAVSDSDDASKNGTVVLVNEIISATDDALTAERSGSTVSQNVLTNDKTSRNGTWGLRITSYTQGTRGAVLSNGDGTFSYTPDASKDAGQDSFNYTVMDEKGNSKSATVQVTLKKGWDTPQLQQNSSQRFTFANGDIMTLWPTSEYSNNFTLYTIWARIYHPGTGWGERQPVIKYVSTWKAEQSATGDVFVVAVDPSITPSGSNNILAGTVIARHYAPASGWDNGITQISGQDKASYSAPLYISAKAANGRVVAIWPQLIVADATAVPPAYGSELWANVYTPSNPTPWGQAVKIDAVKATTDRDSNIVTVLGDAQGRTTVIWTNYSTASPPNNYFYANAYRSDNNVWASAARIDKPAEATDGTYGSLATFVDGQGNVTAAWKRTDTTYQKTTVWASRLAWNTNGSWSPQTAPTKIQDPAAADLPVTYYYDTLRLVGDSQGNVVLAWRNNLAPDPATPTTLFPFVVATRYTLSGGWSPRRMMENPPLPGDWSNDTFDLAYSNSSIYVIFGRYSYNISLGRYTNRKLWIQRLKTGADTTAPVLVQDSPVLLPNYSLPPTDYIRWAANGDGDVSLFLYRPGTPGTLGRSLHVVNLASWTDPTKLPSSTQLSNLASDTDPLLRSVLLDKQNNMTVIWSQNDGYYSHLYAHRYQSSSQTWDNAGPTQLDGPNDGMYYTGSSIAPMAQMNDTGEILVAWPFNRNGYADVITRRLVNGAWEADTSRMFNSGSAYPIYSVSINELYFGQTGVAVMNLYMSGATMPTNYYLSTFH